MTPNQPEQEGYLSKIAKGAAVAGIWAIMAHIGRIELKPGERDNMLKRLIRGDATFEDGAVCVVALLAFFFIFGSIARSQW